MKRLFPILCTLAALASCGSNNSYTIIGYTTLGADGDSAMLSDLSGENVRTEAIKNGRFTFKGEVDSLERAMLAIKPTDASPVYSYIYLEPGTITVKMNEEAFLMPMNATGTPTNDRMAQLDKQLNEAIAPLKPSIEAVQNGTLGDEEAEEVIMKIAEIYAPICDEFISNNYDNMAGVDLFLQSAETLSPEKVKEHLSNFESAGVFLPELEAVKEMNEATLKTAVGSPYIDFEMNAPDGTPLKLSQFVADNKLTLVDFWASWCGPCCNEMPALAALYKEYKPQGLQIVGVSLDTDKEAWESTIKELKMSWPQMSDLQGAYSAAASQYCITSIPLTLLVAQDGTIVARGLRGDELKEKIAELLN